MIPLLISALSGLGPSLSAPADSFDAVELSHVCTERGEYRFSQVICWDMVDKGRWKVQAYVMLDHRQDLDLLRSQARTGRLLVTDRYGKRRVILFKSWRESATAYDPEQRNRHEFPMKSRRGLTPIPHRQPVPPPVDSTCDPV